MNPFGELIGRKTPLVLPGVYDALSARMAERAGFEGLCIGGAAVGITQLALPDIGLQSFGEYRDSVARIREGSALPVMLDGENGFGDDPALVARTVRSFERLGIAGLILEDLLRLVGGSGPQVIPLPAMTAKLETALDARAGSGGMWIVGRTDAAHAGLHDELLPRARRFQDIGVDAILATGLRDLDDMRRLRDSVSVPLIALVVETKPWVAPTPEQIREIGFEIAMYPAALMLQSIAALDRALEAVARGETSSALVPLVSRHLPAPPAMARARERTGPQGQEPAP